MSEPQHFPFFVHPTGGASRLILVRHGQTTGNAEKLLHGRTDLPLTETGRRQAGRAAERIAGEFAIDSVVSSPLQRASDTASIIGERVGITPEHDEELVEMDFGDFEGISVEKLFAEHPDIAAMAFDPTDQNLRWPNGESRSGFHQRVGQAFRRLSEEYDGKTTVIVSHNGVLGSFLAQSQGQSPDNWQAYRIANCAISLVEIVSDGTVLHSFNDCDHLDGMISTIAGAPDQSR